MRKTIFAIAALVAMTGCSIFHRHSAPAPVPSSSAQAQATIINIGPSMFNPNTVSVRAGSVVYWKNNDQMTHRIVLDDKRYDSSDIAPGRIGCGLILNDSGTHTYHDMNNPSLTGTINVSQ